MGMGMGDDVLMAAAAALQIYSGPRPPRLLFYLIPSQELRMESAQRRGWLDQQSLPLRAVGGFFPPP